MFKLRITSFLLVVFLLLPSTVVFGQASLSNIDKSQLNSGIVSVDYKYQKDVSAKVMISKGNKSYTYNLKSNNRFPLQFEDGEYTISILENVAGNKYKVVKKEKVTVNLTNKNEVFLQSIQIINWNKDMDPIKKAKELTKDIKDDKEKVKVIYNYIINNVSYDYNKAKNLPVDYVSSIEDTMKTSLGICYDYSVLLAAMLRSIDIPTKLIMGYKNDIKAYHGWNQVYLKDIGKWVTIDTTYDSIKKGNKESVSMIKNDRDYLVEKQY
ncbi:hypothetical protein GCM10008905_32750 [Clostridium malenominatum]|uniref:Transglutaminase-like domain-containing protein n=1 Tax=Clostridium malenominatum TaxID=1539 RepID=A0ABP3UEX5_9CLOT